MQNKNTVKYKIILVLALSSMIAAITCLQLAFGPRCSATPLNIPSLGFGVRCPEGINEAVFSLAVKAYNNAKKQGIVRKEILTIVDYSLPSTERRMWVIDMSNNNIIFNEHVAHGVASGDKYATRFSNKPGSKMSSLGVYLTADIYHGNWGKSLNLHGLDGEFNSNALARRIVIHKATYVSENTIKRAGRLGRSFGCLALGMQVGDRLMQTIKGGSVVFCYYPDKAWLTKSVYVNEFFS